MSTICTHTWSVLTTAGIGKCDHTLSLHVTPPSPDYSLWARFVFSSTVQHTKDPPVSPGDCLPCCCLPLDAVDGKGMYSSDNKNLSSVHECVSVWVCGCVCVWVYMCVCVCVIYTSRNGVPSTQTHIHMYLITKWYSNVGSRHTIRRVSLVVPDNYHLHKLNKLLVQSWRPSRCYG